MIAKGLSIKLLHFHLVIKFPIGLTTLIISHIEIKYLMSNIEQGTL